AVLCADDPLCRLCAAVVSHRFSQTEERGEKDIAKRSGGRCVSVSGFCVSNLWAPGDHSKQERVSDDDQCGVRTLYFLDDLSQTADTAAGDGLAAVCHRHRAADIEG